LLPDADHHVLSVKHWILKSDISMEDIRMQARFNLLNPEWWRFEWRYWRKQTPWDTQTTPPEVMAFIQKTSSGRALDLGCGTGTNAITLSKHGWQVTGVDFSPKAIIAARKKAARQNLHIDFYIGSVAELDFLSGPFDYALDIGCLFSLKLQDRHKYAAGLKRMLPPGARYMLYAWLPQTRHGRKRGISAEEVGNLFFQAFTQDEMVVGHDGGGDSAWYWFTRR
jgi:2-polyprenyl-3-methyl-5-hydroxy-6-metoxy-1,4-benzoquinol methylase